MRKEAVKRADFTDLRSANFIDNLLIYPMSFSTLIEMRQTNQRSRNKI